MPITTFAAARAKLAQFVPPSGSMAGNYTLDRMRRLMAALGNPQDNYKVVHLAGTSGKTSTAYFMAALLCAAGQKVGLTVSPHVDEINERIQIGLVPLDEHIYCRELTEFLGLVEDTGLHPTYFELLVAFAYWEFARQKVDYAVVEVGLGGLLDGTNVVTRGDKMCVLTDIGLDHTDILGRTLPEIAAQKAGIILPDNIVVTYRQSEAVAAVFRRVSAERVAVLHEIIDQPPQSTAGDLIGVQCRNWYLAARAYELLAQRDNLPRLSDGQLLVTQTIAIPARMESVRYRGKTIVFDGAHNGQKMQAFVASLRQQYPDQKIAVLVGMVQDKYQHMRAAVKELTTVADVILATRFLGSQDLVRQPLDPGHVADACHELGYRNVVVYSELREAVLDLLERPEPVLVVTGSFYLMRSVRKLLAEKAND